MLLSVHFVVTYSRLSFFCRLSNILLLCMIISLKIILLHSQHLMYTVFVSLVPLIVCHSIHVSLFLPSFILLLFVSRGSLDVSFRHFQMRICSLNICSSFLLILVLKLSHCMQKFSVHLPKGLLAAGEGSAVPVCGGTYIGLLRNKQTLPQKAIEDSEVGYMKENLWTVYQLYMPLYGLHHMKRKHLNTINFRNKTDLMH